MTAWFIVAAAVLIVELFIGTVYLLVVSAALFGAGLVYWLTGN
ncbi:MAG: NfeD family protein, partial [Neisseria sp.]|nr:NfeD family protein [Neisseria sp.]